MKMPAPLCAPWAPVMSLIEFSLYVCLRVTFVFLFAPKFLNCFVSLRGFVFVALCSEYFSAPLCVCVLEHGYVDVEFFFTHPSSTCLYPVWEILGFKA